MSFTSAVTRLFSHLSTGSEEIEAEERGADKGGSSTGTSQKGLFLFIYEEKRVVATRPHTYASALATCRKLFPRIPLNAEITFQSKDLDVCKGELADISPESFEQVVPLVTSLVVDSTIPISGAPRGGSPQIQPEPTISVFLDITGQPSVWIQVRPSVNIMTALYEVPAIKGQSDSWYFVNERTRQPISMDSTFSNESFQDQDVIHCEMVLVERKPVIYLSSPREIEATVRLSLAPQWSLSVIYPVVPSKPRSASSYEEVEWRVRVHPNGDLTELTTGLDVAYLFWEARANPQLPISPPPSPLLSQLSLDKCEEFNPLTAVLTDDNSVILTVAFITPYLDRALKVLGLHTEARTSFITYWLPSFLKHKHVVLRFLPQAAYEKAAPLEITPKPDNITRVFMLFQGVEEEELIDWKHAQARSVEDVAFWADVVCVDLEKASDPAIFRVLEWGGMEVPRSKLSPVQG